MPPVGRHIAEYWTLPLAMRPTSLVVTFWTRAAALGPVTRNSPMWETSKTPTLDRTARCSSMIPA
jgi:hypothetical protein